MSRIQSSVGIISGIPIQETVEKLMAIAAQPREMVVSRTKLMQSEAAAVDKLASLVLALKFDANKLKSSAVFNARTATSSDTALLTATASSTTPPTVGTYRFTPVQTATAQQWLSQSFNANAPVGAGSLTIRTGGFVDKGVSLDELNAGTGIQRGEIRITDRSGASAVIDLRFARSADDVLTAINSNTTINVTAETVGGKFRLVDNTGQSAGNLLVQEVNGGTTAASLGLANVDEASASATGIQVLGLHADTKLDLLNDGNGVQLLAGYDLKATLKDGTNVEIDLGDAKTLGEALDAINTAIPEKLTATISADGLRIELTDLTAGGGSFTVSNVGVGTAATDLGLTVAASGNTIEGRRVLAGLRDVLVTSLRGGKGLGTLGEVDFTNRANTTSTVNLAGAETLGEIIQAFNTQANGVKAAVNGARNGIALTDTSGGSSSDFIVANGDATNTATALGLVASQSGTKVNSGTLDRQTVSEATSLSTLNRGAGVKLGSLRVTDSAGQVAIINLSSTGADAKTVGDVINAINASSAGVEARLNDTGDGILLIDTAGGAGTLTVAEVGNGSVAADLKLLGTAKQIDIGGTPTQAIDGTSIATVTIDADDKLSDVVKTINDLKAGVTASIVNDGTGQRLSLTSNTSGTSHELLVDAAKSPFNLQQVGQARDALLLYGSADSAGGGILLSSKSNTFNSVVSGLNVTVVKGSTDPVTVNVAASDASLVKSVEDFVAAYNSLRANIDAVTSFDPEALTTGILFGTSAVLRVESDLGQVVSGRFFGVGAFQSLGTVGITLDAEGKMQLDKERLQAAFDQDPASLQRLFDDPDRGVVAKVSAVVERLAGSESSTLGLRGKTLADKIEVNEDRIAAMNAKLDRERERLTLQFYQLEQILAKLFNGLDALSNFSPVPPLSSSRNS